MNVSLKPGAYVVAVSGGVDSVVLLDLLSKQSGLKLSVAHFDHGIRSDSADDAEFVKGLAQKYKLPFFTERVDLGVGASEAAARQVRYDFLYKVSRQNGDAPIVLAHHQDDLLETAIHNIIRGTGRRGLTSLRSTDQLIRPLLDQPKQTLLDYALQQNLSWREDTTNHDQRYTRNYIRHRLLVCFDADARQQLLTLIATASAINDELDEGLTELLGEHTGNDYIDRRWFCNLTHDLSKEVLASWLRTRNLRDFNKKQLELLSVNAKVAKPGTRLNIMGGYHFEVQKNILKLIQ